MINFNELASFIDEEQIRHSIPEQHYITLMEHMSNLRQEIETINSPNEQYRLNIKNIIPHLVLSDDNEYEIIEDHININIIFYRNNILYGMGSETDFPLLACIDSYVGKPCEILNNGKIRLDFNKEEISCFRIHCRSCCDKGNDDCDHEDCPWLRYKYYPQKFISWEKL